MSPEDILGLRGKVAVVTGGGGVIGTAAVLLLAQAGANVLCADIDGEKAGRAAAAARRSGGESLAFVGDVRHPEEIERMVQAALDEWDRVDVGVNIVGGGVALNKSILELRDDEWEASVETNLYTAVRCSRVFARVMLERKIQGSLVNIASPAGLRAPGMVAYGASKAALINFTWTLAVELAPHGIRANIVVPAFVPNPDVSWGGTEEEQAALARRVVPMGRVTRPEDVAGAIVAFASGLTSYSTGQMIVCDGGRLLTNPINSGSPT